MPISAEEDEAITSVLTADHDIIPTGIATGVLPLNETVPERVKGPPSKSEI